MFNLKRLNNYHGPQGPLLVVVMDGIGLGKEDKTNAVFLAEPKNLISLKKDCESKKLYTKLKAHGPAVGLPTEEDMGNSEVGHNAMGAGKIYSQGAKLVNESIQNGTMFTTELWKQKISKIITSDKTVHLIGLLSNGNVHSHIDQLFGILDGLARSGVRKVRVHPLLDGRDVGEKSALDFVIPLENKLAQIMNEYASKNYNYRIASGGGRMYVTMDRYESDWNVVKRGWDAHVRGVIQQNDIKNGYKGYYHSAKEAIEEGRKCFPQTNDQTAPPFVIIDENNQPIGKIMDGDMVINFNFRGDRAIQISKAFEQKEFTKFDRVYYPNVEYLGLLQYDDEAHIPKQYLVPPPNIKHTLSDYCCANGITQFAIAETHKFGHVTYFWNGNRTGYICADKELYIEIKSEPSEMIPSNPVMKAYEVCDRTIQALESGKYKFIRVNFANGDMVGHTGLMNATITAVKTVDECVGKLVEVVNKLQGITIVMADHGNAEEKINKDGSPRTAHTTNPVPFYIIDNNCKGKYEINYEISDAGLTNLASTILNLLGFEAPEEYRRSLIKFN